MASPIPVSVSSTNSSMTLTRHPAADAVSRADSAYPRCGASRHRPVLGRLHRPAHRPPARPRCDLLMVKADGSVSIHADDRAYKPLNWMSPPCRIEEAPGVWRVVNKAGEELRITLEEIFHDTSYDLGLDPGLVKDGVEAHLQELLAAAPQVLGDGFTLVRREYPTAIGPVDLLCRDVSGATVAVEVKRRGEIDGVEQLTAVPRAARPGSAAGAGVRRARRAGDQATGPGARPGSRHPVRGARLRRPAWHRARRADACSEPSVVGRRVTGPGRGPAGRPA